MNKFRLSPFVLTIIGLHSALPQNSDVRVWSSTRSSPYVQTKTPIVPQKILDLPGATETRVLETRFGTVVVPPNVRIHPNNTTTQSEMSIAVHPTNKNIFLAGSNAVHTTTVVGSQGWYYTTNGGTAWTGRDTLPTHIALGQFLSDPAVGIDLDGRLFFNALTIGTNLLVARSTNSGMVWSQVLVPGAGSSADKNHLTIDVNPTSTFSNYVYTAYTDFGFTPSPISFSRSTNNGATFSSATSISGGIGTQFAQGINLAVGPSGEVYAAWSGYDAFPTTTTRLGFNKSTNGGTTWGTAQSIRTVAELRGELNKGGNFIRVASFPSVAVDRSAGARRGWIYIVYPERNPATPDVMMIRSTNGGTTWSAPRRVNSDLSGKDQWQAWASVDPTTGLLAVVYYDSRNFAANDSAQTYVSFSLDGGDSFEDVLMSDRAYLPRSISGLATGYQGDYIGIAALSGTVMACWNDNRTGIHQAYTARMDVLEAGTPRRISVSPDSVRFGNVFINRAETLNVSIRNIGFPDTLTVSSISSNNTQFIPLASSFILPGGQGRTLPIVFRPTAPAGLKTGSLTILSNDSLRPTLTVPLSGTAVFPPQITVAPDSFVFTVNEGDSITSPMTIGNTGLGPLSWQLSLSSGATSMYNLPLRIASFDNRDYDRNDTESKAGTRVVSELTTPLIDLTGKKIGMTNLSSYSVVAADLRTRGALVYNILLPLISGAVLDTLNILMIDDATFSATSSDINYIRTWVQSGRSLFIQGDEAVTNYNAMLAGTGITAVSGSFSNIFTDILPHPITEGVDSVDGGGTLAYATITSPAQTIVRDLSAQTHAAVSSLASGRVLFVGNEIASNTFLADTRRFVNQAFDWLAGVTDFLSATPTSGNVSAGGNQIVQVKARSFDLDGGTYRARIQIASNDPIRLQVTVPVRLNVVGRPNLVLGRDSLDFSDAFLNTPDTLILGISNNGSDTLRVTSMTSNNSTFSVFPPTNFVVAPRGLRNVTVLFLPTAPGVQTGVLAIASNDPSDPTTNVRLRGNAVHPPCIVVAPDSVSFTVNEGDSTTSTVTVSNTGLGPLSWSVSNEYVLSAAGPNTPATRRVLAWVPYADLFTEYPNTLAAIRQFYSDFIVDTSSTLSPTVFASQLSGKDVLIVPEQERISDLTSVGSAFSAAITSFLSSGRTVIVLDYGLSGGAGATTFLNGTGLLDIASVTFYTTDLTVTVVDTAHALTRQLPRQFFAMNGSNTHTSLLGRTIIRDQSTSRNVVTVRDVSGGTVIYIGMDFFSYNSDMARLLSNAVQYGSSGNWLSEIPTSGVVPAGGNQIVQLRARSSELDGGVYRARATFSSNDPLRPQASVAVRLTVIGRPNIVLSRDSLDFGEAFLSTPDTLTLGISNNGSDTLRVTGMTSNNPVFLVFPPLTFTVAPRATRNVTVLFLTATTGTFTGNVSIASNDPSDPTTIVRLRGVGVHPPQIALNPDSLAFTVTSGDSATATFRINNTGLGTLTFSIDHEFTASRAATSSLEIAEKGNNDGAQKAAKNHQSFAPFNETDMQSKKSILSWFVQQSNDNARTFQRPVDPSKSFDILPLILRDSIGDGGLADVKEVRGRAVGGGALTLQVVLAIPLNRSNFGGYIGLDIDQNVLTGVRLPFGLTTQDVGCEYYVTVFNLAGTTIPFFDSLNVQRGSVPFTFDSTSFTFSIPLTMLGCDDGKLNLAAVFGPGSGPTEWVPDIGHGTVGGGWMTETPESGTIPPGGNATITVRVRSENLLGGTYRARIHVRSNDPLRPVADARVQMRVIGAPNIITTPNELRYTTFVGYADTLNLTVGNNGTDTLRVSRMTPSSPLFTVIGATSFSIAPSGSREVPVRFAPTAQGTTPGAMGIYSNDPNDSVKTVGLLGNGLHPPILATSADSLAFAITLGDSATQSFVISNTGLGPLTWSITSDFASNRVTFERSNQMQIGLLYKSNELNSDADFQSPVRFNKVEQVNHASAARRILAWLPFADRFPGGNFERILSAIRLFYADFAIDTSLTTDPVAFAAQLSGKDLLLVPAQSSISDLFAVGAAFRSSLTSFVASGRTVIVLDYGVLAGATTFLNGTGLMNVSILTYFSSDSTSLSVVDTTNSLVRGLPASFYMRRLSNGHSSTTGQRIVVAQATGQNVVTYRSVGNGHVIYIGMLYTDYNLPMARLLANAVQFGQFLGWLGHEPRSGVIAPGGNQTVQVSVNSRGLECGTTYRATMRLASNDPGRRLKNIPVRLRVTGASHMVLSRDTLNFPESYVGYADTTTLTVANTGCDTLRVIGMTISNPQFSVLGQTAFFVARDSSRAVSVRFAPAATGTITSTLAIASNDSLLPTRNVGLRGATFLAPTVSVAPDSIVRALNGGDSTTATLRIRNTGPGSLRFRVSKGAGAGATEEFFGDSLTTITGGSARMIGNIYSINTPTTLREFRCHLGLPVFTPLRLLVYEGTSGAGPFSRVAETVLSFPSTGTRFHSSGSIDIPLVVGRYYYIGIAYQGSVNVSRREQSLPIPVSFGRLEASGFVGGYPPAAIVTPLRSTTTLWTQKLATGFDFVTSIVPDTASVNPGDSLNVVVRFRAAAPMGTYRGALAVRSNDPARRNVAIPTRLDILTSTPEDLELPREFALYQNYPNPFNPTTTIAYDVPRASDVRLTVYNVLGQEVALLVDARLEPGRYKTSWEAAGFASGIYFYRLESREFVRVMKLIILK